MEQVDPSGFPVWLQAALGVAAVLAAIAAGIRAIPPVWHFVEQIVQGIHFLSELPARIQKQDDLINDIHHETHPNSGGSLKDSAMRTEAAVGELRVAQKKSDAKVNRLVRSQAAFRTETKRRLAEIEHATSNEH